MNRSRTLLVPGVLLLSLFTVTSRAYADRGLSLDPFQPAPAGDRFFGVQGGDPGGELSPRLMLLGDYAYKPMVLYRGDDIVEKTDAQKTTVPE